MNREHLHPLELICMETEQKTKKKVSIGQIFGSQIFEQVAPDQYAVYEEMANGTWKTTTKRTVEQFIPMPRTPLTHPTKALEYESSKQLYEDVKAYIHTHLDLLNPLGFDILASFVFASWIPELFDYTPYLGFYGRESVGKTRALEILNELCFRAWFTTGLTTATLFRLVERFNPTLLLDESEFLTSKGNPQEGLIGLLNAGQRRGVMIPRMTEHAKDVQFFNVYCPKAISGTEQLKRTTTSRMITFTMTKNIRKVPRRINKKEGLKLRNQLLLWRFKTIAKLKNNMNFKEKISNTFELKATTEYPELEPLSGRTYELFYPLYYSAPTDKKNILEFAMELENRILQTEKTQLSSQIFEAIINLKDQAKRGILLISQIRQYINTNEPIENWIPSKTITRKCVQMGFNKTRTNKGTAIFLNAKVIERLKRDPRYTTDLLNFSEGVKEMNVSRGIKHANNI